jgi:hypothetical protein
MERESGFQGIPGESRVKLALLRESTARSQFNHTQVRLAEPGGRGAGIRANSAHRALSTFSTFLVDGSMPRCGKCNIKNWGGDCVVFLDFGLPMQRNAKKIDQKSRGAVKQKMTKATYPGTFAAAKKKGITYFICIFGGIFYVFLDYCCTFGRVGRVVTRGV